MREASGVLEQHAAESERTQAEVVADHHDAVGKFTPGMDLYSTDLHNPRNPCGRGLGAAAEILVFLLVMCFGVQCLRGHHAMTNIVVGRYCIASQKRNA